ncbi:hypothetical protein AB8E26_06680 [Stenotrophomonas rhizophila]|uniref:hypothetical protein n=1 Tax=Stenotrophomonas rhizophila TaxID=216778 RepID=UPI00351762E9
MESRNDHTPPLRNPGRPGGTENRGAQLIGAGDYQRLWRAASACRLLAAITEEVAVEHGIDPDDTAAVAEYIRDDMYQILSRSKPADE